MVDLRGLYFNGTDMVPVREEAMMEFRQNEFNESIGRLDRILSLMICWSMMAIMADDKPVGGLDEANRQTLKHHAEDMIGAGQKILLNLGEGNV